MRFLTIISACNEGVSLDNFLPKLQAAIGRLEDKGDILVVDDGSSDGTATIARKHRCLVLRNSENMGIGASLRRGYRRALRDGYDLSITMDADGQHDPEFLGPMLAQVHAGADIVIGSRYHPDSERVGVPLDRDFLNIAVMAQVRVATGWEITDPLSGFWAMRRSCIEFALKHGRQARYGIHLEHLVKFWYLAQPQPVLAEIAHPAIYANHGTRELLTREYSAQNREARVERFGTHALHILEAIEDVKREVGEQIVAAEMAKRRHK